jgi:hypothetical protein
LVWDPRREQRQRQTKPSDAPDSGAAKDDENSAKKKAATQDNDAKKAQGKSSLEEQAHAMAEKVAYKVVKAFTPKRRPTSALI